MKKGEANKKTNFRRSYFWIGMFFLFVQILVVLKSYFINYHDLFWFCDFVPMLFALAFLFRKEQMVKAIINFGLFVQIYFLISLFGGSLSPELVFSPFLNFVYVAASFLLHLSVLVALALTYKIKPKIKTVYFSTLLIMLIYFVTLIFTAQGDNFNKVYLQGDLLNFDIPYFTLLWPVLALVFLVLPTQALQYLLYRLSLRKTKKSVG